MGEIFISYANEDRKRAKTLAEALEREGWSVWWDRRILPGKTFDEVIDTALAGAKCVVVLWSKSSAASNWVRAEASEGARRGILVPVLIEEVAIPFGFRQLQIADLRNWQGSQPHSEYESLLKAILEKIGQPPGTTPKEGVEIQAPEEFTNSIGMKFVLIPAGTFVMGSPPDEEDRDDDEEQHEVTISKPFYLQTTQVTPRQWKRIMKDNPSHFKKRGDDCPVESVSWDDAQAFMSKLNKVEGGKKYRLPTEAEWEYACRAGSTTRFCFGDDEAELREYAWYVDNSEGTTHPVGHKEPNAWDLYDMHGNVYEWCQDWYGDYPTGHVTDPTGAASGLLRVLRGGSWGDDAWYVRSAYRNWSSPGFRYDLIGFRLARDS